MRKSKFNESQVFGKPAPSHDAPGCRLTEVDVLPLYDWLGHVELFDEVVDDRSFCLSTSGQKRAAERETEQEGDDQRSAR